MSSPKTVLAGEKSEPAPADFSSDRAVDEIDDWDLKIFRGLINNELTADQLDLIANPDKVLPRQRSVMAVHWHPEWIPLEVIQRRIGAMYPGRKQELIIPTQHNRLMVLGDYAGVEVDAQSTGFNRKVQLLLHFKADKVARADVLTAMLDHTFKYRSSQLFEFIDSIINPDLADRLDRAADKTGANEELIDLVRFYTLRLKSLIDRYEADIPAAMIKNKLLTEYVDAQRDRHPDQLINRANLLLKAIKVIVKADFSLDYFFRASEIIEEARALGGGVVIPHPEQFWPILLADYDVDGYEVWNPQSREYTDFLIRALDNQNKNRQAKRPSLLTFMGDDTHMSVKLKDPTRTDPAKFNREIGLQPAWNELSIRKSLSLTGASRRGVIEAYRDRLG